MLREAATPTAQRAAGGNRPHIASAAASPASCRSRRSRTAVGQLPTTSPWATSRTLRSSSESSAFRAWTGIRQLGRIDLNLITFLACSGGTAASQVIDAVWNGRAIERSTLWNRIAQSTHARRLHA